ncbi:MAG: type II secretion system protein [Legionellaceae bacterium]|nr:type II secretion system protein [Legionellaceae bacterium]
MKTYNIITRQGFSLIEVLVCLMIISGTSLVLFKQQMQLSHSVRKIKSDMSARIALDNAQEQ